MPEKLSIDSATSPSPTNQAGSLAVTEPISKMEGALSISAQARLAMTRARSALVLEHPFFGSLALRLTFKEDPGCNDLWVDGRTLGFNPVYAATLPENKLIGAQAHEIMHLACGHHVRRKNRDEKLWNQACDYAVNQILLDSGFALPEGFLHNPEYNGSSVDDIYALLSRMQDQAANNGAKDALDTGPGSEGEASGSLDMEGGEEHNADTPQSTRNSDESQEQDEGGAKAGKLVAHDEGTGEQAKSSDPVSFQGEVRDHPSLDGQQNDSAQKAAETESDIALTQAMQRALSMGDLPAGFTRLLKRTLYPTLDWRAILQRFLENCADSDYSWTSPNRRYIFQDIYLPSRREPQIPQMVLAIDCSGSVDEQALAAFCAELSTVLEAYDTTLTVLFHDTKVQAAHTLGRQDLPLALTPLGGGGTDYTPISEYIAEHDLNPACLLWFTDLECDRFPEEPDFPVLWISSRPSAQAPPFGEVLNMPGP